MREKRKKCALVFFGIDRRLDITAPSIFKNVIAPAEKIFDLSFFGHLWALKDISNKRSGEVGELPLPRLHLLPHGKYVVEEPSAISEIDMFQRLTEYGDFWQDDFKSLRNLYSQLTSLKYATELAINNAPEYVIFLRPDLVYHDNFESALRRADQAQGSLVQVPNWQGHKGLNDRFAICSGLDAIRSYGKRLEVAIKFCEERQGPIHAERLVKYALEKKNIVYERIPQRASRIRIHGELQAEDFSYYGWRLYLRETLGGLRNRAQAFLR